MAATFKRYFDNNAFSGSVAVKLVANAVERTKSLDPRAIAELYDVDHSDPD